MVPEDAAGDAQTGVPTAGRRYRCRAGLGVAGSCRPQTHAALRRACSNGGQQSGDNPDEEYGVEGPCAADGHQWSAKCADPA